MMILLQVLLNHMAYGDILPRISLFSSFLLSALYSSVLLPLDSQYTCLGIESSLKPSYDTTDYRYRIGSLVICRSDIPIFIGKL